MKSVREELSMLQKQRCERLDFLQTLDMDKLAAKPLHDKWSILEIVHHLVLTEQYVLRQQWDANQRWLKSYVHGLDSQTAGNAVFRHPVAGPLTAKQTL